MPTITNLQNKTHRIVDSFFNKIGAFTLNNDNQRSQLLRCTKDFFEKMNKLDKEAFAKIFTEYNFSSTKIEEHEKYQLVVNCLVGLVVEKYSQSDLLRYFFPENLSKKESRPEYSSDLSRISHWFQLIGYWLRQLVNKPNYDLKPENNNLAESVNYIKYSLKEKSYLASNTDNRFKTHLGILVKEIEKKAIHPSMNDISRENFKNAQEYHQVLVNKAQGLQTLESNLQERDIAVTTQENELSAKQQRLSEQEQNLQQRSEFFEGQEREFLAKKQLLENREASAIRGEESYQERLELLAEDRRELERKEKSFETEIKDLKEKISNLNTKFSKEKFYISHLEHSNLNLEKSNSNLENSIVDFILEEPNPNLEAGLEELIKEFDAYPNQASQNFTRSSPSSSNLFKPSKNPEGDDNNQMGETPQASRRVSY